MTQEQKERLTAWRLNILVTFRIDYFRGIVLFEVAEYIRDGGTYRLMRLSVCVEKLSASLCARSEGLHRAT